MQRGDARGLMTTETCLLLITAIAGLLTMGFYVQRALQGNFFGTTQSIGLQFDPRDHYREEQHLDASEVVRQQPAYSMAPANHLPTPDPDFFQFAAVVNDDRVIACGGGDPAACERRKRFLRDLPTAFVFREPSLQRSELTASWAGTTDSDYRDHR